MLLNLVFFWFLLPPLVRRQQMQVVFMGSITSRGPTLRAVHGVPAVVISSDGTRWVSPNVADRGQVTGTVTRRPPAA